MFLQELWMPYHDKKLMNEYLPDYSFQIATPDMFQNNEDKLMNNGPVWHGCAIAWHKDLNASIEPLESNHERLAGVKLIQNNHSLLLVSLYAPTSGHDDDFMETLSHLSQYILLHSSCEDSRGPEFFVCLIPQLFQC